MNMHTQTVGVDTQWLGEQDVMIFGHTNPWLRAADGRPVELAYVRLDEEDASSGADADERGRFVLAGLSRETVELRVEALGLVARKILRSVGARQRGRLREVG